MLDTDAGGVIEIVVAIDSGLVAVSGGWHGLRMRALVDEAGGLASWECAEIDAVVPEMEPCGP